MRKVIGLTAAALAALLVGCTHTMHGVSGGGAKLFLSTKHDCKETSPPTICAVAVDPSKEKWVPDVLVVHGKSDRDILFELVSGYEFLANNGIAVDASESKIKCKAVPHQPRQFECKYKRSDFGVHKYTINARANSGILPPYDPFFINE